MLTGVVAVALVAFTGWQALKAKDALTLVAQDFQTLGGQLAAGDRAASHATLTRAQENAAVAAANTSGPGWWLTSRLPGVGPNVEAVRTVADVTDRLSQGVLPAVVRAAETIKPASLRPLNGRVALEPLKSVAREMVTADRRLQEQADRVLGLSPSRLAPQIAQPVRRLQRELTEAASLSDRVSRALRLLPPMLGDEERRSYLLLFQNNAELRATGGIPGSFAIVHARDGRITLGAQGDAGTLGQFVPPAVRVTRDERALFGTELAEYPQNVTFTPDFPRSAQIIRQMWNARQGVKVDGVISTDPVALSYLLRGTGPVTIADGRSLTARNAVDTLLSRVYREIEDPAAQNLFFADAARRVFDTLAGGQGDPEQVLRGLVRGASDRRILLWSAFPEEQRLLAPTRLAGELPREATESPHVGVFLNDGTGNKLGFYLHHDVSVTPTRCQGERQILDVTLELRSTVPSQVRRLPDYVALPIPDLERGTIRTTVLAYAPVDGYVDSATLDQQELPLERLEHDGRSLVRLTVDVAPGQARSARLTMVAGEGQHGRPELRVTPGVNGSGVGTVGVSACS